MSYNAMSQLGVFEAFDRISKIQRNLAGANGSAFFQELFELRFHKADAKSGGFIANRFLKAYKRGDALIIHRCNVVKTDDGEFRRRRRDRFLASRERLLEAWSSGPIAKSPREVLSRR